MNFDSIFKKKLRIYYYRESTIILSTSYRIVLLMSNKPALQCDLEDLKTNGWESAKKLL